MKETVSVNGTDLDNLVLQGVEGTAGLYAVPAKRTANVPIPRRHGALYTPEKRYDQASLVMPMWIRGVDVDGCIPDDPSARVAFYVRVRALVKLFTLGGQVTIRHTLPDSTAREITAEVVDLMNFTIDGAGAQTRGRVSVGLSAADPFWTDITNTAVTPSLTTGQSVTLTDFAPASAPMDNSLITFYPGSNPVLSQPSTGMFLAYDGVIPAGRKLVIDTAAWTVIGTIDAGGTWVPSTPPTQHIARIRHRRDQSRLFTLNPGDPAPVINLTHTAGGSMTVSLSAAQRHLVP